MDSLLDTDDPRISSQFVRGIIGWPGSLTIVGVVHGHPASVYRVQHVIDRLDPDLLALELPPLSIPTYRDHARDSEGPPAAGGEMSAAIQSATTEDIRGIDGPSRSYFVHMVRTLLAHPDPTLIRDSLGAFASVTTSVLANRMPTGHTPKRADMDFQVGRSDPPTVQADHEREQITHSKALLEALQQNRTKTALQVENATRERHMVDRLVDCCEGTDSVAVVGVHHLEELTTQLDGRTARASSQGDVSGVDHISDKVDDNRRNP